MPVDRETLVGESSSQVVTIGVRPEDIDRVADEGEGLAVDVDLVEELGADGYLYGHSTVGTGKRTDIVARVDGRVHPNARAKVYSRPPSGHVHLFDPESGLRLSKKPVVA